VLNNFNNVRSTPILTPSRGKERIKARIIMTVGMSIRRIDGAEKVTGAAKFTGDLSFSNLLEAKVLRGPPPHALIESIVLGERHGCG
jgi:hypothetical protein